MTKRHHTPPTPTGRGLPSTIESFALDRRGADRSGRPSVELGEPASTPQSRSPASVSQRGADGVSLDFEPIAAPRKPITSASYGPSESNSTKIHPGYELTFCATGSTGYYDVAGLTAGRGSGCRLHHGLRLPDRKFGLRRLHRSAHQPMPVYDLTYVVNLWEKRTSASKIIVGCPTTALPGRQRPTHPMHGSAEFWMRSHVRLLRPGGAAGVDERPQLRLRRAVRLDLVPAHLQWSGHLARALLRRCPIAGRQVTNMINYWNLRGMGHLGARLRRRPPRDAEPGRRQVPQRQNSAQGRT